MKNISIQLNNVKYIPSIKLFIVGGKNVPFGTKYSLKNEKTGTSKIFDFDHSTGSEWDKDTLWIYKSEDGFTLNVSNSDLTQEHIDNYLEAKTR